jgi:hypothetical protein
MSAPRETKNTLAIAVKAPAAPAWCSAGASLPKTRLGSIAIAMKSKPIRVALAPTLPKKKFVNSGGTIQLGMVPLVQPGCILKEMYVFWEAGFFYSPNCR